MCIDCIDSFVCEENTYQVWYMCQEKLYR